jgi:type VI secretion system secreted protein VgrG
LDLQFTNRGNRADYVLGTLEGWRAFDVVHFRASEELSQPYRYEITLLRDAESGPVDLDGLVDSGATLRIATEARWRSIHGIVAEAEELDRTARLIAYRVLLVPHFWRARFRRRCRNFVDEPLEQVITAVLENRSAAHPTGHAGLTRLVGEAEPPPANPAFGEFDEPVGLYRLALLDERRIRDARIHPYVVQYNESDFDFLSRLLESEGISYWFEHTAGGVVMTLTDQPGQAPLFPRDERVTLRPLSQSGGSRNQEVVRSIRDARRARSRNVTVREFDFMRSRSLLEANATGAPIAGADPDFAGHFEFPAGDEHEQSAPAKHAAEVRAQRFEAERQMRTGRGTVRVLEPGKRFRLIDEDGLRPEQELLVVAAETTAAQLFPEGLDLGEPVRSPAGKAGANGDEPAAFFETRFTALPVGTPFRPEVRTPKPQISGVQTATVTAEEHADSLDINADSLGRVRLRFPWDQRPPEDGRPSSAFIRVAQYWAGQGYGALYTPRVGHEVLVAFLHGDPARPVIVGRVYNAQNKPPYDPTRDPTVSTLKSKSSKVAADSFVEGFNELRFTDMLEKEEVFLHAQRDLNETVRASHSTSVGGDQSNSVGGNQSNSVTGNRVHGIKGTENLEVVGDRTAEFLSNEIRNVSANRSTEVGATDRLETTTRVTLVKGDDMSVVSGQDVVQVGTKRTVQVGADHEVTAGGSYRSEAAGNHELKSTNTYINAAGAFQVVSTGVHFIQGDEFVINAAGCTLSMSAGMIWLDNGAGAAIGLAGGLILLASGTIIQDSGTINLKAGGDINATAATIKLNG